MRSVELKKKKATKVYNSGIYIVVKLYNTEIVKFNSKEIILDSNGWKTVTTKARMNQASKESGLGIYIKQVDNNWYVMRGEKVIPFTDGMRIKR